jgi:hypothetical protein
MAMMVADAVDALGILVPGGFHENLTRAMITGRKRAPSEQAGASLASNALPR